MNDRYLFRAKRIDNEEWVQGYYVNCLHPTSDIGTAHFIVAYPGEYYIIYTSTLCQCTGLKDKNGNLIWENDICRYYNVEYKIYEVFKFAWDCEKARFSSLEIADTDSINELIANSEVIGSYIDNPELLEVE